MNGDHNTAWASPVDHHWVEVAQAGSHVQANLQDLLGGVCSVAVQTSACVCQDNLLWRASTHHTTRSSPRTSR
jgi:hypothetical protein